MKLTSIFGFKKRELTDLADITLTEDNWDTLETELKELQDADAAHKADFASYQFGDRPYVSTEDKTYYIDEVNGSDDNDGLTEGTALKTLQKALSITPLFPIHQIKWVLLSDINLSENFFINNINVINNLRIEKFFEITSNGDKKNIISNKYFGIINCSGGNYPYGRGFSFNNISLNNNSQSGLYIDSCLGISINNCDISANKSGISCDCSFGICIESCSFSNVSNCISANSLSYILSFDNTGSSSGNGLYAGSSHIMKRGSQPTGSLANEVTSYGGVIC